MLICGLYQFCQWSSLMAMLWCPFYRWSNWGPASLFLSLCRCVGCQCTEDICFLLSGAHANIIIISYRREPLMDLEWNSHQEGGSGSRGISSSPGCLRGSCNRIEPGIVRFMSLRTRGRKEGRDAWLQKLWTSDHHLCYPNHALMILIKIIYIMWLLFN